MQDVKTLGVATTLVSAALFEDKQRAKCGGAYWRSLTRINTANICIKSTKTKVDRFYH
jgi:hypothetical protein